MNFADFTPALAKNFNWLLLSGGERCEDFAFTIQSAAQLNDGVDLDVRFKLIDLTRIPNLKRIKLWIEDNRYFILFLGQLVESGSLIPMLETLDIYYLSEHDLDWEKLDDILQHPYFHALREIKTSVKTYSNLEHIVGQESG